MREKLSRKFGDQALKAYAALGLEEIRAAIFQSGVARPTEPGMWGDRAHSDVYHDRKEESQVQGQSLLAEKIEEAQKAQQVEQVKEAELTKAPEASRDAREQEAKELTQE